MSIDAIINEAFGPYARMASDVILYSYPLSDDPEGPKIRLIVAWLALAAVFFSFYLRFVSLTHFRHGFRLITGRHKEVGHADAPGELSNFQAISTCLSGTVGLGNIAGVAVAISMGGPGAAFWMGLMGFFGMCSKFAEAVVGCKYRERARDGVGYNFVAGPMYYIKIAFAKKGMGHLGVFFAVLYALFTIGATLGGGNMFQVNQVYMQFVNITGGDASFWADKGWLFGLIIAVLVGGVIIGGLQSIARTASLIVPTMALLYLMTGLVVILMNYDQILPGIYTIVSSALSPQAGLAGILGSMIAGVQRAAFSNEAGLGSAAFTHSFARTREPVSQGFVAMIGPFVDTVIICMMTALVIVISGVYTDAGVVAGTFQGVTLTSRAFATVLPWFPYVLALAVFLFAYSTQITWYYYGLMGCTYLFGQHRFVQGVFTAIYLAAVVVGCSATLDNVIDFTDATFLGLAIPNILALYLLAPEIRKDTKDYLDRINATK